MATEDEDAVEAVSLKDELSAAFDGPEKATQETAPPEVKAPETATPPLEAPKHWSTDDRTEFTTLPRKVQERWLARETEYARGIDGKAQELARIKRDYEALEGPLKPFERELGLRGVGKSSNLWSTRTNTCQSSRSRRFSGSRSSTGLTRRRLLKPLLV
jgi:hypothetical protein